VGKFRVLVASLLIVAGVAACGEGIVTRAPIEVLDVPGYGDELRSMELNPPEPASAREYTGPGYYVRWAPSGRIAAVSTDARGYYRTVSVWDDLQRRRSAVVSVEDGDPGSGRAYRYAWSRDGKALLIYGHGRLADGSEVVPDERTRLCLVYMVAEDRLSRIFPCRGTKWAF
jgi:hypothetical protein